MNDDAVWAETTDGGLLRQLFGFYPTMHDARIVSIEIDRESDRVTMVVDYNDMIGEDDEQELSARIRLEWSGISSFELPLGEVILMGLEFSRRDDRILTSVETYPGVFGTVLSEGVEAVLVQLEPGEFDDRPWIRYK